MAKLMEQSWGAHAKEGPDKYINDFFTQDVMFSPKYREDEKAATQMLKVRLDSRGSPMRRTFLGNVDTYNQGK